MKFERGYAQHLGSRQEQQDAGFVLSDDGRGEQLVVVADGMGGHAGGSIASAEVAATAKRLWAEHQKTPLEPKRLLERIVREGHESINKAGAEKGLTPRSTCALLFVRNGSAHWAHVGDSRIYRLRAGQLTRLTRDHSVVQMLVDLGKVSEEEMGTHPDQNRLTQSLGGDAVPMPDFGSDSVQAHDAFLICSDGLWEMIPQPEMAAALAAKKLGDDGAKHLADRAFDRAKPKSDNITVALLRIDGPPLTTAAFDEAATTRLKTVPRRSPANTARWAFAAATVVGLAAAVVLIKPWETRSSDPAAGTQKATPQPPVPPRAEEPKREAPKPDAEPQPAERRAPPPPAPPIPSQPPAQPPAIQPPAQPPAAQPPAQPPAAQPPAQPQPGTPPSPAPGTDNPKPQGTPPSSGEPTPPAPQDGRKKEGDAEENPTKTPPASGPSEPAKPPAPQ